MSFESLISYIACIFSLILAGLVLRRDPKALVHRIFAVGMLGLGADAAIIGLNFNFPSLIYLQELRLGVNAFLPGIWLIFSVIFARQNYHEYLIRWKWILIAGFAIPLALLTIFNQYLFEVNAVGVATSYPLPRLLWSGQSLVIISLLGFILIIMNLEKTLRSAVGAMRWQVKFTVFGLGGLFAVHLYALSQIALYRVLSLNFELIKMGALIVANLFILRSLFRTRLFNAEIYVSQSMLYNSLTILIIGIYFIAVGVLAEISKYFGGDEKFPIKAFFLFLAISGVAILAFSDHFRRDVKLFVSRNFHRPIYDYRKEWTNFTQRTASISEMQELYRAIIRMVSETFSSLDVSLWLFDEKKEVLTFKASTALSNGQTANLIKWEKDIQRLAEIMRAEKDPMDLELPETSWASEKPQFEREFLKESKIRYCVSMRTGEQFLGILTLGSRVANDLLSLEDFDLLRTIADQAAVSIRQLKLADELKESAQIETLQALSSFMIHDLKNVASTLSLTMQNMPVHFDNPEFREDAIGMIDKSLTKIKNICSGLSSLRQKVEIKKQENDINELVKQTISSLNGTLKSKVVVDFKPLGSVSFDSEQMQKVLTNLILNAEEAMKDHGEICVETGRSGGWAVVSVRDNGCGMSREFMEKALFRPFKTTKKQGMGIGLFQSKMIVEAHGGKIEVESEENVGSIFRVLLPLR